MAGPAWCFFPRDDHEDEAKQAMTGLQCKIELCLAFEDTGILLAGWLLDPDPAAVVMDLVVSGERPIVLGPHLVRVERPDVLDALAGTVLPEVLRRNQNCGFLAFAPRAGFLSDEPPPELVLTRNGAELARIDLVPERLVGSLDPAIMTYLKHDPRAINELVGTIGAEARQALGELLGSLRSHASSSQEGAVSTDSTSNHGVEKADVPNGGRDPIGVEDSTRLREVEALVATVAWLGSDAMIFSNRAYLDANPDVALAFGTDCGGPDAYHHWVRHGAAERRQGFPDAQKFAIRADTRDAALGLYCISQGATKDAAVCVGRAIKHFRGGAVSSLEEAAELLLSELELSSRMPQDGAILTLFCAGLLFAVREPAKGFDAGWFDRLGRLAAIAFARRAYPDRTTDVHWWCELVRDLGSGSSLADATRAVALSWSNRLPGGLTGKPGLTPPVPTERFVRSFHLLWAWLAASEGRWLEGLAMALAVQRELFTFREGDAYQRTRQILAGLFSDLARDGTATTDDSCAAKMGALSVVIREIWRSTFGSESVARFDGILSGLSGWIARPAFARIEEGPAVRSHYDFAFVVGVQEGESKRYRVINVADALRDRGWQVATLVPHEAADFVAAIASLDVLVLFRCALTPEVRALIHAARSLGARVVYDIDDLFFRPDIAPLIRGITALAPAQRSGAIVATELYRDALLASDAASLSTAFLAEQARALGIPSFVLPNTHGPFERWIAAATPAARTASEVWIAYFSGTWTHQVDFQECEQALLDVMAEHREARLLVVGHLQLGDAWEPYADRIRREPYQPHPLMLRLHAQVDICLAPLEIGNPYCEAKSELKIFEAGLFGVPTVASDTEPYRAAIDPQSGFLARTPEDFRRALSELIGDRERRLSMGANARERALEHFSDTGLVDAMAEGLPSRRRAPGGSELRVVADEPKLRICVLVPDVAAGSGGFRSIFRLCQMLHLFGHSVSLCLVDSTADSASIARYVREHFGPFGFTIRRDAPDLPFDVIVATFWTTVRKALRLSESTGGQPVYFVQDFEPWFYPLGSDYFDALETYKLGVPIITYTSFLKRLLKDELDLTASHVDMVLDRSIYHPRPEVPMRRPKVIHLARPEMPRRCFPTCARALAMLKTVRPDVEIVLYGSPNVDVNSLGFECQNLGVVSDLHALARLYSEASVGLSISPTNPSHVPFEMLACGLPVVDFRWRATQYNDPEIASFITYTEPDASALLLAMLTILDNPAQARARARNAWSYLVRLPGESEHGRQFERAIVRLSKGSRREGAPSETGVRSALRAEGRSAAPSGGSHSPLTALVVED